MAGLLRRRLELREVEAKAALVLGRVHRHPHPLRRREVLLPRQRDELAVGREKIVDVAHSELSLERTKQLAEADLDHAAGWRNSIRPRCDAANGEVDQMRPRLIEHLRPQRVEQRLPA